MTWVLIAIAAWLTLTALTVPVVWALGRAAANGDREERARVDRFRVIEAEETTRERRTGARDRRAGGRPWAAGAPGRRADDIARRELAESARASGEAEGWAELEARRSAV